MSLLIPISDFWPLDQKFLLFLATRFVVICYSSFRKLITMMISVKQRKFTHKKTIYIYFKRYTLWYVNKISILLFKIHTHKLTLQHSEK